MSMGEFVLLLLVGIVVVGPRNLPAALRTAGHWVARLRRLTTDLRNQSGIDDILQEEGLSEHFQDLRSLSKLNVVGGIIAPAAAPSPRRPKLAPARDAPPREREYPLTGCDGYGVMPDDIAQMR